MNAKVLSILGLLLALCGYMAVMTSDPWYAIGDSNFLQPNNIENLLRRTAMYGVLGIGVAFVIITSGIDLSIGSVVCLSGCLLAMFLNVNYEPFDHQPIYELRAKDHTIVVSGDASSRFKSGDQIRFFGGRRARNVLLKVSDVTFDGAWSLISVEGKVTNDDSLGQIAKVYGITEFANGQPDASGTISSSRVTLSGSHNYLSERDQLVLAHPESGLKQIEVVSTETAGDNTVVTLGRDLGSNFSTDWVVVPLERRQRMSIPMALLSVLGIAAALGLIHGLLVTRVQLQPFVVTLCGLLIYRGLSRWLVSDQPVGFGNEFEHTLSPLGNGKLVLSTAADGSTFGIPYPFFILIGVAIVAAVFLNRTIWGRYLLALGRNEEAAHYSGINTGRVKLLAYLISTGMAAVGGILFSLDSNSISPSSFGNFFELYAIAAAVLGGCSLRGGEGSIVGVIIGTALMQVLYNLIVLMKISGTLEFAIIGAVILIGVVADEVIKRVAARRRAILQARQS
jgi:ribose transport system permease protein